MAAPLHVCTNAYHLIAAKETDGEEVQEPLPLEPQGSSAPLASAASSGDGKNKNKYLDLVRGCMLGFVLGWDPYAVAHSFHLRMTHSIFRKTKKNIITTTIPPPPQPPPLLQAKRAVMHGVTVDIHEIIQTDATVNHIHGCVPWFTCSL